MSGNIAALRLRNRMYAGAHGAALQAELADAYQLGAWRQLCAGGTGMAQMLLSPHSAQQCKQARLRRMRFCARAMESVRSLSHCLSPV